MSRLPDTGELQRRINIRLWSDVPNEFSGIDQTFSAGIWRWAKREPVHGLALRAGMQTEEAPTDLWWVRYGTGTKPEDITQNHVIEWNGLRFRVLDTINVEDAQRFTRITTKLLGPAT
ncbi:MAG: head-tail adaptor protein [Ignavibacteria bacterium]